MAKKSKFKKTSSKMFSKTTFSNFKKMTLDAVIGHSTPLKIAKNWAEGLSNKGIGGVLRDTFITNPKSPSAAQMHEWAKIHRLQRENHPIAVFLLKDVPSYFHVKLRRLEDAVWWVKYRTIKKHNFHTVDTGLKPGYHMSDEILLYSSMAILADYVENSEHSGAGSGETGLASYIEFFEEQIDPKEWSTWERKLGKKYIKNRIKHEKETLEKLKEILTIYRWWKYQREAEHLALDKQQEAFYSSKQYHFIDDERDPSKLKGKEKKKYLEENKISQNFFEREEELYQIDTEMMLRLVKIRQLMW